MLAILFFFFFYTEDLFLVLLPIYLENDFVFVLFLKKKSAKNFHSRHLWACIGYLYF